MLNNSSSERDGGRTSNISNQRLTRVNSLRHPSVVSASSGPQGAMMEGSPVTIIDGKLRSLNFEDKDIIKHAPVLMGAMRWESIKDFTIMTGVNGSGKSQLLQYLEHVLKSHGKSVVRVKSDFIALFGHEGVYKEASKPFMEKLTGYDDKARKSYLFHKRGELSNPLPPYEARFKQTVLDQLSELYGAVDKLTIKKQDYFERDVERIVANIVAKEPIVLHPGIVTASDPVSILNTVLSVYMDKKAQIEKMHPFEKDVQEFKEKLLNAGIIIQEDKVLQQYKTDLLEVVWGSKTDPLQEINDALKNFKHSLYYKRGGDIEFRTRDESAKTIPAKDLSSGEKIILSVLSWQYCQEGISYSLDQDTVQRRRVGKADIFLLDEPDAHLDPKLSALFYDIVKRTLVDKLNIQVIMTTHRPDSIALAPEDSNAGIFTILPAKNGNPLIIAPCTKMHAMFRLTHNLRALTNLHFKVYTEAFNDSLFYQAVYGSLRGYCEQGDIGKQWVLAEDGKEIWNKRTLSKRYQQEFYSSSFEDSGGGGKDAVETVVYTAIRHEVSAYDGYKTTSKPQHKKVLHQLVTDSRQWFQREALKCTKPFGVHDSDYYSHNFKSNGIEDRVIRVKRHSVENFTFDPFIVASAFKEDNDGGEYIGKVLKRVCDELNTAIDSQQTDRVQGLLRQYFRIIFKECLAKEKIINDEIRGKAIRNGNEQLVDEIMGRARNDWAYNEVMHKQEIIQRDKKIAPEQLDRLFKHLKPQRLRLYKLLEEKGEDLKGYGVSTGEYEDIGNGNAKIQVILGHNKIITVEYPIAFLRMRGHDIEHAFPVGNAGRDAFRVRLFSNITGCDDLCIPTDLADIFFNLDSKIRDQAYPIVKPGWRERIASERAASSDVHMGNSKLHAK